MCADCECLCVFAFSEPLNLPVLVRHVSHWTLPNQCSHVWVCVCVCVCVCAWLRVGGVAGLFIDIINKCT